MSEDVQYKRDKDDSTDLIGTKPDLNMSLGDQDGASQRFYSYSEVANAFGRSTRTIRWWVKTERLKAIKIGRARYIPASEIDRLLSGTDTFLDTDEPIEPASDRTKIGDERCAADK